MEFEQWDLGPIWLDGESFNSALNRQLNNSRLEGKHGHFSGIDLQNHQKSGKHLGKLKQEREKK